MKPFLFIVSFLFSLAAFGQRDSIAPAYKRYPTLPALQLILSDSTTVYTKADVPKKKPVLLMLFSPDCEHCQHEAEQMVLKKDSLKRIHIVMATSLPIYKMKAFAEKYGLNEMTNVVVARDEHYSLLSFYEVRSLPYMALYDKKGKLITTFQGSVGWEKVLAAFQSKQ